MSLGGASCSDPKPRMPLFVDCREVDGDVKCPGDSGYSVIPVFGKTMRLRKDSPPIMLMGCLDELSNIANGIRLSLPKVGGIASIIIALSMQLNAYLVQGTQERLEKVKGVLAVLEAKVGEMCSGYSGPLGWAIARSPEGHALDSIRVKLRECGRVASSMLDRWSQADNIVKVLNHADKVIAQSIYCMGSDVYSSVDDATKALLKGVAEGWGNS